MSEITGSCIPPLILIFNGKKMNLSQSFGMPFVICNIVMVILAFSFPSMLKSQCHKQDGFLLNETEGGDLVVMGQILVC